MSALARLTRTARRAVTVITLTLAAAVGGAIVAPSANAAGTWQYWSLDSDRYYDAATIDTDGNGYWNEIWYDGDNDNRLDIHLWNSYGGDWLLESMTFNMDEDAYSEFLLLDTNQAAGYEWLYTNSNDDNYWDSVR